MKSKYFLFMLFVCLLNTGRAQQLFNFEFAGAGVCPTQNNQPEIAVPSSITVTGLTRSAGLSCVAIADGFSTSGFGGPGYDFNNNYIDLTIEANAGYYINISSMSFVVNRAGTSPPLSARVAHNVTGAFTTYTDFLLSTTGTLVNWTSFTPFSLGHGSPVTFRFYGWNESLTTGSSTGSMRLDKVAVYGSITTIPLTGLWVSSANHDVYNTNTANIGIGTTTPQAKLDVNGDIFTNGKLLIGTTNLSLLDDYSLAVNGNAIFNKIKIKLYSSGWPDYVFNDSYELPTLSNVEAYLKKYKHLPGVPPASEMEKQGLDVANNEAVLLKKLEELTLYIIELNKKIEQLSTDNEVMKTKVNSLTHLPD